MKQVSDKKLQQLDTLMELSSLIISTLDTREIRKRAIEAATRLMDAEAGSLLLIDQETGELFFEVALGEKGDKLKEIRLKKGEGIAGWVSAHKTPLIVHDVQSDPRFYKQADEKTTFLTKNMICVPVQTKDKVLGVLEAINKKNGYFNEEDLNVLNALANQVAIAVENANLYQELKDAFYGTAMALADTIEKRDPYTGGHIKRVTNYSAAIGRAMGLSKRELEDIKLAAILHDIGKIGVRDEILLKKGKLSTEDMGKMSRHSEYGAEILSHVKQLRAIVPGVRSHHERFDGNGYPHNLRGNEIPLIAKIIAVADTFDAMTTDRPYRKAMSFERALEELKNKVGTQFDKEAVEAFIKAWEGMEIIL
ncbi:MAG: HD domain-containing protein [Nitrospira sp.]|nr:HD domain-containing protein [Nitrospira sp.]